MGCGILWYTNNQGIRKINYRSKNKMELYDYMIQQQQREAQLLSNILKCFDEHKQNTLKDIEVLKHNIELKKKRT